MNYPTAQELGRMGVALEKDIQLCSAELRAWFGRPQTQTIRTQAERPTPKRVIAWPRRHGGKRIA